jgi:hypothetical protein
VPPVPSRMSNFRQLADKWRNFWAFSQTTARRDHFEITLRYPFFRFSNLYHHTNLLREAPQSTANASSSASSLGSRQNHSSISTKAVWPSLGKLCCTASGRSQREWLLPLSLRGRPCTCNFSPLQASDERCYLLGLDISHRAKRFKADREAPRRPTGSSADRLHFWDVCWRQVIQGHSLPDQTRPPNSTLWHQVDGW